MSVTCPPNCYSQFLSFLVFPDDSVTATSSQFLQMLHELVVALRGHPGHVFQEREGKFLVNPALSLFHPCEVALLNQVDLNSFNLQEVKSSKILCSGVGAGSGLSDGGFFYLEARLWWRGGHVP